MKISTLITAGLVAFASLSTIPAAMAREAGEAPRHEDRRSEDGDDRGGRADRSNRVEAGDDRGNRGVERGDDRGGRSRGRDDRGGRGR